jgi:hypothetical protein
MTDTTTNCLGKTPYADSAAAHKALRAVRKRPSYQHGKLVAYSCACGMWHLGNDAAHRNGRHR